MLFLVFTTIRHIGGVMSSLETLDRAANAVVSQELGEPNEDLKLLEELGVRSHRFRPVGGLAVVSNAARDAAIDENAAALNDQLLHFRANRQIVETKLKQQGVTPVAILPLKAWNKLCDRTQLFRFTPNQNTVRISPGIIAEAAKAVLESEAPAAKAAYVNLLKVHLPIALLGLIPVALRVMDRFPYGGWGAAVTAVSLIAWAVRASNVSDGSFLSPREQRETTMIRSLVKQYQSVGSLFLKLWPNYFEPESKQGQDLTIHIALPQPPQEIAERIIAAERTRLPMHVAVVGEAISLQEDVASILIKEQARLAELAHVPTTRDPIVYVVEGTAVAIVAQFGDFPIEKDVMLEVLSSEYLA